MLKLINWKSDRWQRSFVQTCPALPENELLENGSVHCGHIRHLYYTFYILRYILYKCTSSWKIVPIIVVTINGEGLHCTHNGDQLALTCKVSRITYSGWFQTAIPPHHTGKTRRFRNPYRATKVLRHGEIIIDFIKKIHIKNIYGTRIRGSDLGIWELVAPDLRGVNLVPQTNPPPPAPPQQHSY